MIWDPPWDEEHRLTRNQGIWSNKDMPITADLRFTLQRAARRVIAPALAALLVVYFAYYALYGDRGLSALHALEAKIAAAEVQLAQVRSEREQLEQRVSLLRPESLDPDMLEERARAVLNMTRPDEMIILLPRPAPQTASAGATGASN